MRLPLPGACRVCLAPAGGEQRADIFSGGAPLHRKIMLCADVQVSADDGFPSCICGPCLRWLQSAYKFRRRCERSAARLRRAARLLGQPSLLGRRSLLEPAVEADGCTAVKREEVEVEAEAETEAIPAQSTEGKDVRQLPPISVGESVDVAETACNSSIDYFLPGPLKCSVWQPGGGQADEVGGGRHSSHGPHSEPSGISIQNFTEHFTENLKGLSNNFRKKQKKIEKSEQCSRCGKLYRTAGHLAHHMSTHSPGKCNGESGVNKSKSQQNSPNTTKKAFVCSACGKSFSQAGNLAAHRRAHTGERPFQCDICLKAFTQVGNLYVHKRVHAELRAFQCEACPRAFKLPAHLAEHAKTHRDFKEYQCTACGKRFHKSSHLLTHRRTHTGEKPFSCEHCGKSFNDSSNLATHIRIHTGERPFRCKVCDKSFAQKISMSRHEKQHSTRCGGPRIAMQQTAAADLAPLQPSQNKMDDPQLHPTLI